MQWCDGVCKSLDRGEGVLRQLFFLSKQIPIADSHYKPADPHSKWHSRLIRVKRRGESNFRVLETSFPCRQSRTIREHQRQSPAGSLIIRKHELKNKSISKTSLSEFNRIKKKASIKFTWRVNGFGERLIRNPSKMTNSRPDWNGFAPVEGAALADMAFYTSKDNRKLVSSIRRTDLGEIRVSIKVEFLTLYGVLRLAGSAKM